MSIVPPGAAAGARGGLARLALSLECGLGLRVAVGRCGKPRLQFNAAFFEQRQIGLGPVVCRALVARLGIDLGELDRDLFAALRDALRLFRELEYGELRLMMRLSQFLG